MSFTNNVEFTTAQIITQPELPSYSSQDSVIRQIANKFFEVLNKIFAILFASFNRVNDYFKKKTPQIEEQPLKRLKVEEVPVEIKDEVSEAEPSAPQAEIETTTPIDLFQGPRIEEIDPNTEEPSIKPTRVEEPTVENDSPKTPEPETPIVSSPQIEELTEQSAPEAISEKTVTKDSRWSVGCLACMTLPFVPLAIAAISYYTLPVCFPQGDGTYAFSSDDYTKPYFELGGLCKYLV